MDSHVIDLYFRAVATPERTETPYAPPPDGLWIDLLRFVPGSWTWRRRGTPDCLLMVTVGGAGELRHARGTQSCARGDVLLLMPDAPHDYGAAPGATWDVRWSHFTPPPGLEPHLAWPELEAGIRHLRLAEGAAAPVEEALPRGRERLRGGSALRVALASHALAEAVLLCDQANPLRGAYDARVRAAIDALTAHLDRPIRVAAVARAAGLSVSRLSRLFQRQTGASIRAYLERRRLELACQRLALTDEPVQAIATGLGFASPFYFTRRFHRMSGLSPSAYRDRARAR